MIQTVHIVESSNQEFLEKYARAGCIGLSCGTTIIDKAIARAERRIDGLGEFGDWSHAFVFQGRRPDGHHWVIESDLQIHRKHIQLGVQENRISKYFDEGYYSSMAILDFGLSAEQLNQLLCEGLDLVANHERYSLRELLGTLVALRSPALRGRENLLSRERSMYCSAFVQHLYRKIGLELSPGVHGKNTTPEDLARTGLPHTKYLLKRTAEPTRLAQLRSKLRGRIKNRVEVLKKVGNGLKGKRSQGED